MCVQSDLIQHVLAKVSKKLNIKKWRYEIQTILKNVISYASNIVPVALKEESSDVTIHLMIKSEPNALSPEFESIVRGAYKREVYFYSTLVPLFKDHMKISCFFPECYYANSYKARRVLVLQNMSQEGFQRCADGRFLDHEHLALTLEAVAHFHSFSLILKAKNIKPENDQVMEPFSAANEPVYANSLKKCFKQYGVDIFEGTPHEELFKSIYATMNNMDQFLDHCVTNAHALVYGHGDMWKENLLFKYSGNKPTKVCLLDYQMCHLVSPAYDVLFLLMNSIDSTFRRKNYHSLLSTYYKALERSLQAYGLDSNILYSKQNFHDDLKLVFQICFSITVFSFALWLGLNKLTSLLDSVNSTSHIQKDQDNLELFVKIIGNIITDFRYFGVIN